MAPSALSSREREIFNFSVGRRFIMVFPSGVSEAKFLIRPGSSSACILLFYFGSTQAARWR